MQTLQTQLNQALWAACQSSRGPIEAAEYKNYLLVILFLKVLSDTEEEGAFCLPVHCSFPHLFERRKQPDICALVNKALWDLACANGDRLAGLFDTVDFDDAVRLGADRHRLVRHFLEDFQGLDLSSRNLGSMDVIGNGYEFLLEHFAAGGGRKSGEYYTPPGVAELLARLVDPQPGDRICDPTCGSGSLLIRCGKHALEKGATQVRLYGQEITPATWGLAKMNMVLHGFDQSEICLGDVLQQPRFLDDEGNLMQFDAVVANPPFSLGKWGWETAGSDPFGRFHRGVPPRNRGDFAFISHVVATLKPGGQAAMVVASGVLYRRGVELAIRKALLEEGLIHAVIQLPAKLFYGASLSAAVLVLKKAEEQRDVLMVDARSMVRPGRRQNRLCPDSIAQIMGVLQRRRDECGVSRMTPLHAMGSDYVLCPGVHVIQPEPPLVDPAETFRELLAWEAQCSQTLEMMKEGMRRLGLYG